jgi:hypothetical protein
MPTRPSPPARASPPIFKRMRLYLIVMLPHLFDAEMIAPRAGRVPSYKKGNG